MRNSTQSVTFQPIFRFGKKVCSEQTLQVTPQNRKTITIKDNKLAQKLLNAFPPPLEEQH